MRQGLVLGVFGVVLMACGGSDGFQSAPPKGDPPPVGGGKGDAGPDADAAPVVPPPPPKCDISKLPTEDPCVIDESVGVFASSSLGVDGADGTRAKPYKTIQAAIASAKISGRRVYACAEQFDEALSLEDGVSIFGYHACNSKWEVGTNSATIKAPTTPAVTAMSITKATRIEALSIFSPNVASGSTIAFFANGSSGLHLVNVMVTAGSAGAGADGTNGVQLADSSYKNGSNGASADVCWGSYKTSCESTHKATWGGQNACTGEAGHNAGDGGDGTASQSYQVLDNGMTGKYWSWASNQVDGNPQPATSTTAKGGKVSPPANADTGSAGANGNVGSNGANVGTFSASGYATSDGVAGAAGQPGQGGGGGAGTTVSTSGWTASSYAIGSTLWGVAGSGGGAGGCPGLAGTAGKGGGASVGIVAIASPMKIESSMVQSGKGGAAGKAGAGSSYTQGGSGGYTYGGTTGGVGGNGGIAGWSGSGGGGPSITVVISGTAPTFLATTFLPGPGGAGAPLVNNGAGAGPTPASPSGMSAQTYNF